MNDLIAFVPPQFDMRELEAAIASDDAFSAVVDDIRMERLAQDAKWGQQNHPDGTNTGATALADSARRVADMAAENGNLTWADILTEEFYETVAEEDVKKLRGELVQLAAVAVAWVEAIDRRA